MPTDEQRKNDFDFLAARILVLQIIQTQTLAAVVGASEDPTRLVKLFAQRTDEFVSRLRPELQEEARSFSRQILEEAFHAGGQSWPTEG